MPDNPTVATDHVSPVRSAGFPSLPGHRVLQLSGRDAAAFAHAQFMSDVTALAPGHWHWSGWLTPKGRVVALFALLRVDAETLWLLLPDADPATLAGQLQRFVFRSKLAISVCDERSASGSFDPPARARADRMAGDRDNGLELDFSADGGPRTLRIDPVAADPQDPQVAARWTLFDLAHGLPRLGPSQIERWTPQQLSLQRLQAYSVKKGCYPGQEIVARTHFLGQAKRALALFESDAAVTPDCEVRDAGQVLGSVVSAASDGASQLALAVISSQAGEPASPDAEGIALRPLPLRGGLAR